MAGRASLPYLDNEGTNFIRFRALTQHAFLIPGLRERVKENKRSAIMPRLLLSVVQRASPWITTIITYPGLHFRIVRKRRPNSIILALSALFRF